MAQRLSFFFVRSPSTSVVQEKANFPTAIDNEHILTFGWTYPLIYEHKVETVRFLRLLHQSPETLVHLSRYEPEHLIDTIAVLNARIVQFAWQRARVLV